MNSLRAVKVYLVHGTPGRRQRLGFDGFGDKQADNYSSGSSEASSDSLEAGFGKRAKTQKPGLGRRLKGYGLRQKTTFVDWSYSQSRSFWASLISALLGIVVILVLVALAVYFNIHLRNMIPHNDIQRIVASWGNPGSPTQADVHYPTDFSRDINPIPCHSHNDYWRKVPLYDALAAGCTGVEADVWLTDNDLLVGHSTGSLTSARSLTSLYIGPLMSILAHQNPRPTFQNTTTLANSTTSGASTNGIFETNPGTSLTLLIDVKSNGTTTLPVVLQQLEPLRSRGYLTYFNGSAIIPGPITIVGTGNTPFDLLTSNTTYRDIFFDAPLDQLWGNEDTPSNATLYTAENSYYASVDFASAIGKPSHGILAPEQVDLIVGHAAAAAKRGLKARYWNTPKWPVGVRDHVWDVLVKEGVGMLNVDDLEGASRRNWRA